LTELTPPLSAEDHVDGQDGAELELVMYGDFQCPYCTAAYPIVKRVRDQLGGRLLFAFRHFPLRDVHPDAQRAAEASEAAAAQGAFWEMHDAMYESRGALSRDDLIAYARARLAAYKCPKRVIPIGELPMNAIGKLDRDRLRELAGQVRG